MFAVENQWFSLLEYSWKTYVHVEARKLFKTNHGWERFPSFPTTNMLAVGCFGASITGPSTSCHTDSKTHAEVQMGPGEIVALIVGGIPVAEIVKSIVVPPFAVLGKRMADRVERMFGKTGTMVLDAGFTPQPVSDKLIVEIVRGASLEDDEDLHTMWAALLANAASPDGANKVRPGFIAILRQMAPDEATLLKWTHDHSQGWAVHVGGLKWVEAQAELGFTSKEEADRSRRIDPRMAACLDGLEAQQLVRRTYWLPSSSSSLDEPDKFGLKPVTYTLTLTERGTDFLNACRAPKPKA